VICLDQEGDRQGFEPPSRFRQRLAQPGAVQALRALLAEKDPAHTVVHVHTWTKALSPFALATGHATRISVIVTPARFFHRLPNGGFFEHGANVTCTRTLSRFVQAQSCRSPQLWHKVAADADRHAPTTSPRAGHVAPCSKNPPLGQAMKKNRAA